MRIHAFMRPSAHQQDWVGAFCRGLARHGLVFEVNPAQDAACDVAVFWSHRWRKVIAAQRAAGRDYVVLERGYLGDRMAWTSVGRNGLNGRADFAAAGAPADRFERHFAALLRDWRTPFAGGHTLVIGQVPGDAAIQGLDVHDWADTVAAALRARGERPVFRPHPLDRSGCRPGLLPAIGGTLADALDGAARVVTFSSNAGVDAALAGVPVCALDRGAMAWPVATHALATPPAMPDRTAWAAALAYSQWNKAEIEAGVPWARLYPSTEI
jgi:hypothetical protein